MTPAPRHRRTTMVVTAAIVIGLAATTVALLTTSHSGPTQTPPTTEPTYPATTSPPGTPLTTPPETTSSPTNSLSPSPTSSDSSPDPDAVIEMEVSRLRNGQIVFEVPRAMRLDHAARVVARVSKTTGSGLASGLPTEGPVEIAPIKVSSLMKVVLRGEAGAFDIEELSETQQVVLDQGYAEWQWTVRPLHTGTHTLYLRATATITATGGTDRFLDLPVLERKISVEVSAGQRFQRFLGDNWQWVAGTALSVGLAYGAARGWFKRKRPRRRRPSR